MPRFTIDQVRQKLAATFPTATVAVKVLEDLGIVTELTELTEQKKNRSYGYTAYISLLLNKNFDGKGGTIFGVNRKQPIYFNVCR